MRHLERWDVANPERTLADVLSRVDAEPDDVLVAMLRIGEEQELVNVTRVHSGAQPDFDDARDLLCRHAQSAAGDRPWEGSRWRSPEFLLVTVVCREGRVVPTAADYFWLTAWRFSNHGSNAFDGDVYLVTEHGWTGCTDQRAGFRPRLGLTRPLRRLSVVRGV